jgi:ankyrin repeat protein
MFLRPNMSWVAYATIPDDAKKVIMDKKVKTNSVILHEPLIPLVEFVQIAIQNGADINAYNGDAINRSLYRVNLLECFIKNGADTKGRERDMYSSACMYGNLNILKYVIKNVANISSLDGFEYWFFSAVERGYLDIVKYLIPHGITDDACIKAFHLASEYGHPHIVKYLISRDGSNINIDEAFCVASQFGFFDIVKYLVEHGANIHIRDDYALSRTSEKGYTDIVEYLIDNGANIHAGNDKPIRWASEKGHLAVVECLILHGANIHAENNYAIIKASEMGHLAVVECLIKYGAAAVNNEAFYGACKKGRISVVECLIANLPLRAYNINEALRLASEHNRTNVVNLLIKHASQQ